MTQLGLFDNSHEARFRRFHAENPHVLGLFVRYADEARNAGARRVGAKAIAERIRWDQMVKTAGKGWKLNNNYVSRYARLVVEARPDLAFAFEMRTLKGKLG